MLALVERPWPALAVEYLQGFVLKVRESRVVLLAQRGHPHDGITPPGHPVAILAEARIEVISLLEDFR
jgi:hypothetical protein